MARAIEVEWQFAVRDVDVVARWLARVDLGPEWRVVRRTTLRLRDTYLDTADWAVARTRHALRVRAGEAGVVATLKAFGRAHGGAVRRREIVERLADGRIATVRSARGDGGRRVRAAIGAARLRRLFLVRTRRQVYEVRHCGRRVAELVLDRTRIAASGRTRRLERVEVEVTRGTPGVVAAFVATLRRGRHLKPVRRSKFETGLAAAGLTVPSRR